MKRFLILLLALLTILWGCGTAPDSADQLTTDPSTTTSASTDSSNTDSVATKPSATEPSATEPSATEPPATEPPATEPPATDPPVTEPPATEPPATEPPATEPPATEPPATEPPATEPPVTEPPATEPPATEPPATEPPATEPPATEPPATEPEDSGSAEEDAPIALDFTVYDDQGNPVKLSDFRGKPVVLNFWASWCGPCKGEMPEFEEVYREMGSQVQFLMVNLTFSEESMENAQNFIASQGYTFPVYYDIHSEAAYTYQISSIPATFVIDAQGYIRGYAIGAISKETLLDGIGRITETE